MLRPRLLVPIVLALVGLVFAGRATVTAATRTRPVATRGGVAVRWDFRNPQIDQYDMPMGTPGNIGPVTSVELTFDHAVFRDDRPELDAADVAGPTPPCPQFLVADVSYALPGNDLVPDPMTRLAAYGYARNLVYRLRRAGIPMVINPAARPAQDLAAIHRLGRLDDDFFATLAIGRTTAGGRPYDVAVTQNATSVTISVRNVHFDRNYATTLRAQRDLDGLCIPLPHVRGPFDPRPSS